MEEEINYAELGFKCGLEVHQQLDTKKLFCNCSSVLRKDEPDYEILRKLHVVAGETGEIDKAAEYQTSLKKEFVYQGYKDNVCLVELDEEPPHMINQKALKVAVQIALLLNCKIIPITQIMRKTVVDGSNTSGFQRTVLIAEDGFVETSKGRVGIHSICLEEDSARVVSREKNKDVYRLDRLGIPLIEITTEPDIKTPEQAKEAALKIGEVLRACKVKRGIGTIRQDVNVSILKHPRIEIKGMQDMKIFTKAIENEVKRQINNLEKNKEIKAEVRNVLPSSETEFLRPMPGAARMYPETDLPLLRVSRDFVNEIKKDLPKLKKEIEGELRKKGLSEEMIKLLLKQKKLEEFKDLLEYSDKPQLIAKMILIFPKEIASKLKKSIENVENILSDFYPDILEAIENKKISESDIKEVMLKIASGKSFEQAIKIEKADLNEIEERIMKLIKEKPGLNANAYMGLVMKEFKGKISGKEAMDIINKYV
ncbi:MAG: Glu-tRNA(Gln) amidotransferase subunit GatE [Minisyncoccales bacterium]